MKTKEGKNEKASHRNTAPHADVESSICDAPLGAKEVPRFHTPCRVHIHHTRNRLADSDGVSGKALLDGLVHLGVFADDSPEQVTQVSSSQSKGKIETTTITIEVEQ